MDPEGGPALLYDPSLHNTNEHNYKSAACDLSFLGFELFVTDLSEVNTEEAGIYLYLLETLPPK